MPYQKKSAAGKPVPASLAVGLFAGWVVTLLFAIIIAILMAGEHIQENTLVPLAVVTMIIASFITASFAAKFAGKMKMIMCISGGGVYYLSLICCNALFFDATYCGLGCALLTIIGSAVVAGLMAIRQKKHKTRYIK